VDPEHLNRHLQFSHNSQVRPVQPVVVRLFRTLRTRSLVLLVAVVAIAAVGGTAIAVAGGGGPTPPPKPLAQAVHDAIAAPEPDGVTARVRFTNRLLPSGALEGRVGSALLSGASGRLWLTNHGRGRLELQSTAGDVQIVWNQRTVTVYDASSDTVYRAELPARKADRRDKAAAPSLARIGDFLDNLAKHTSVSAADPTNLAGRPAYRFSVSPKQRGGLLGSVQLAWDAARGVPLRAAIYARGSSKPVLALEATEISFGPVSAGDVQVLPPAGSRTTDLGTLGSSRGATHDRGQPVRKAAGFPLTAPATLIGLRRQDVRIVGRDSKTALVVYGEGLGAIVVAERKADASGGQLGGLPAVPLDGAMGHELVTPLGTVIEWRRGGVSYVLAGSVPSATAEAATRGLK
jgi:outer membrane lipoprotein-sorting protein